MSDKNLSLGEFQRSIQALERSINTRFDSVDERLDGLQKEREKQSERIAVLEAATAATPDTKTTTTWSVIAATLTAGIIAGVKAMFGHP